MDLENFIESQKRLLEQKNLVNPEFLGLYSSINDSKLKEVLASLHKLFVSSLELMNDT